MFAQFKTLPQLFDYFKTEDDCLTYWETVRWNGMVKCPHCGACSPYKTNRGYKCTNLECQKKFSALVGSIFENSKLPLRTWFAAIFLCSNHKKGVSSVQLAADLGIHQKSAWFLLHRIREAFADRVNEPLGGEGMMVEVDSTFVGGKLKTMNRKKRKSIMGDMKKGKNDTNKTVVAGYVERGGTLRLAVIKPGLTEAEMIRENVDTDSVLMTDTAKWYRSVGQEYAAHEIVNHGLDEYVREKVFHTNTIEGAFSHFDRMVMGTYHYVSKKHMQAYCNECAYRYNTRKENITQRFEDTMTKCVGVRITYQQLVNHV